MSDVDTSQRWNDILTPLRRVILRRRLRTVLRLLLVCVLAVLITLLAIRLLALFGIQVLQTGPILAAVTAIAAIVGGLIAYLARRSGPQETVFVDRNSGFEQAYVTALELAEQGRPLTNPLARRLVKSVQADSGDIAPKRLVPLLTPDLLVGLAVALGLAYVASQPLPEPILVQPDQAAAREAETTEDLSAMAEITTENAAPGRDPLLDAISRALAERTPATAADKLSERVLEEINDRRELAQRASGDGTAEGMTDAEGMPLSGFEDALSTSGLTEAEAAAAAGTPPFDPSTGDGEPGAAAAPPGADEQPIQNRKAGDSEENFGDSQTADGKATTPPDGENLDGPKGRTRMEQEELWSVGGRPVGASNQSSRGQSDAAGGGGDTLNPDQNYVDLLATEYDEMVISATPQTGSRIRVETVPETAAGSGQYGAGASFGQSGRGSPEPVTHEFVPIDLRQITARYFERLSQ